MRQKTQRSSKCCWKDVCLCGGVELKPSQVNRHTNPDRYIYSENLSKNRNGLLSNRILQTK